MSITDAVVLVITMWGKTASGEWVYIGNQYVNQTPMPLTECSEMISPDNWEIFADNEYYRVELSCYHVPEEQ
tara:strand:- start:896 stop:1111 length:216 start_codon:yes stop_codon:yes gene_type:complete